MHVKMHIQIMLVLLLLAEFILEDGFPSKTGNSSDGFPSDMNLGRKPSDE